MSPRPRPPTTSGVGGQRAVVLDRSWNQPRPGREAPALDTWRAGPAPFVFQHGFGDICNLAHQIPLYTRRGHRIAVSCEPQAAELLTAAGAEVLAEPPSQRHGWLYPAVPETAGDWLSGNKCWHNVSSAPLPDIGRDLALWREYCDVRIDLDRYLRAEHLAAVDRLIAGLPRPIIVLHPQGRPPIRLRSLLRETLLPLYEKLLSRTRGGIVVLDMPSADIRDPSHSAPPVPIMHHDRLRSVRRDGGSLDSMLLYALLKRADLFLGIDGGPAHFVRFTDLPAVVCSTRLRPPYGVPSHVFLPRDNTLHITSSLARVFNRETRLIYNIVESPGGESLDPEFLADQALGMLGTPVYLGQRQIARDVQLRQFVAWTRAAGAPNHVAHPAVIDRHEGFDIILRHLRSKRGPVIVETGCIRGEEDWAGAGFSTYLLGAFVRGHGGALHSVELDESRAAFARRWTRDFGAAVRVHTAHSHEWLAAFGGPIDVFYSDSLDADQPGNQECCLREVQLAAPKMQPDGLIVIDDSPSDGETFRGKGALAARWLLGNGWRIVHAGYQAILQRPTE